MKQTLFLLDAYALIFRSYYAFIRNPRVTSKGLNTSAIFGFTNTLDEILKKENPSHIAVVFDPPSATFRHKMYPPYKANRDETPEDIKKSVPYIKKLLEGFNIPVIEIEGYEADDTIATLAKLAEKQGFFVYMMTPDKDFAQLVSEQIRMYKPRRNNNEPEIWGIEEVKQNFMVEKPEQVIDVLALMGDASDNIPGAPGIGEKTAKKLIHEFGYIENIYQKLDQLKGKQKIILQENKEQVEMSKKLATIILDVPVSFNEQEFIRKGPDQKLLTGLFEELEFRTMTKRILQTGEDPKSKPKETTYYQTSLFDEKPIETIEETSYKTIKDVDHSYVCINTVEECKEVVLRLQKEKEICFDTETTGIHAMESEIVGLSVACKPYEAWYIPIPAGKNEAIAMLDLLKPLLENENTIKIGQNIKYDMLMLKKYGIEVKGQIFDTMLAHYLLQPDQRHNMNVLAEQYLHYKPVSIEELIGKKGKSQLSMRQVPIETVTEYACEDADVTLQLKIILEKELKENNLYDLAEDIEMPLVTVLTDMEFHGVALDASSLNIYSKILKEEIISTEEQIFKLAGTTFNISSPKQLGDILFERMKIESDAKKTKTKQYSTSEEVLTKLADKHEIVPKILEYRSLTKLLSTYVNALPRLINSGTGKIHTSFNQAVASTGRLSSNNPNLQNIPIREERGREIRKAFVPSSQDNILLSADYSQVELRIMAHLSQDKNMIDAFSKNEDIHATTAEKIYGEATKENRSKAKTANFGIIYGISAFGLSQRLFIPRSEAKELIDGYFRTYPKVKEYMDESIQKARDRMYVETIMGRRRYLADINSRNATVRGFAERNAINSPIQGSAADIIKKAMIGIHRQMQEEHLKSKMVMQVHDELIFDVYKPELEKVKAIVKHQMENAVRLSVPLEVEMGSGNNWLEAH